MRQGGDHIAGPRVLGIHQWRPHDLLYNEEQSVGVVQHTINNEWWWWLAERPGGKGIAGVVGLHE